MQSSYRLVSPAHLLHRTAHVVLQILKIEWRNWSRMGFSPADWASCPAAGRCTVRPGTLQRALAGLSATAEQRGMQLQVQVLSMHSLGSVQGSLRLQGPHCPGQNFSEICNLTNLRPWIIEDGASRLDMYADGKAADIIESFTHFLIARPYSGVDVHYKLQSTNFLKQHRNMVSVKLWFALRPSGRLQTKQYARFKNDLYWPGNSTTSTCILRFWVCHKASLPFSGESVASVECAESCLYSVHFFVSRNLYKL